MDREEARLSPHAGGRLIRQLLEEDSDPMLSPRFYPYGQCQQYLDDTEVPPSPPNAHSFVRYNAGHGCVYRGCLKELSVKLTVL